MGESKRSTLLPPPPEDPSKSQMEQILAITPLRAFGPDIFTNAFPAWQPRGARGIFGGAAIAYSLAAAQATMPSTPRFAPHSLHCYFLLVGQPDTPIILNVERVRDGRSFATRTVQARQAGRCIFTMTVSFSRISDDGSSSSSQSRAPILEHARPMPPNVVFPTDAQHAELEASTGQPFGHTGVIVSGKGEPHERACRTWMRARGKIAGGMDAHLAAMAYMSDSGFLGTIPRAHVAARREKRCGKTVAGAADLADGAPGSADWQEDAPAEDRITIGMVVSLDHAIYFHNPARVRADEWMLSDQETSWAGDERGLVMQRIYALDGTLLATCVQEGVVRLKQPALEAPRAKL